MTDHPKPITYWATAGARATCTSGHTVAIFSEYLKDGETIDTSKMLTAWTIGDHERLTGCCPCGACWRSGVGMATKLHVAGEWIPGQQPFPAPQTAFVSVYGLMGEMFGGRQE